jgi:nucleotide-binding universal stress UspA family protein
LEIAGNIAPSAPATVLHAVEVPHEKRLKFDVEKIEAYRAELSARRSDEMRRLVSSSSSDSASLPYLVELGAPADVILEKAQVLKTDLIVMGKHGKGGWEDMLIGGVTKHVIHHAPCDVLVVEPVEAASSQ